MSRLILIVLSLVMAVAHADHQFHHPGEFIKTLTKEKNPGEKVYKAFCANCHEKKPLINLGAPRRGIKSDWQGRVKRPMKEIFKHLDEGIGAMPARGGCFECDDKALLAAVEYMLPKKQKD